MVTTTPVLIVGAGPTGLVLALRLARHGVRPRIIAASAGPGLASRAMAVHARTLELYHQLGLAEAIVEQGTPIEAIHLRDGGHGGHGGHAGHEIARLPLKDMGAGLSPYPFVLAYPQDDHERFLVAQLKLAGVEVEWNTALVSLTQDAGGVHARLLKDGVAGDCHAQFVCGCDGAHSAVRESLQIDFPGEAYEHLYYVADVKVDGEANRDLVGHLAANTFVLMLPVRSSGMQRLIGIMPDGADGRPPASTGAEAQTEANSAAPEPDFEHVRPIVEPLLGIQVAEVNWFSTYRVHHRVARQFRLGRCFIAGDAAHIHSPAGGQGMNTGIGDAANLAWKLAHVLQGRAEAALLDTYEAERIVFARKLVASTDRAFRFIVARGAGGQLLRNWLLPQLFPFVTGFAAARRAIFKTLSQVEIDYEDSLLSGGRAGDILGGDRLPWVAGETGADNFAPLRSLDWQLHVYGEPQAQLQAAAQALHLPLHAYAWNAQAEQAGLLRDAAYLVRPDSYVALALPRQETDVLRELAVRFGLRFAPAAGRQPAA